MSDEASIPDQVCDRVDCDEAATRTFTDNVGVTTYLCEEHYQMLDRLRRSGGTVGRSERPTDPPDVDGFDE